MNFKRRLRRRLKHAGDGVAGALGVALLRVLRFFPYDMTANAAGRFMRTVGPLLPEHKIGRAQLAAAFPEKTADQIDRILRGAWDNLGRVGADFAHLDRLWDYDAAHPDKPSRIEFDTASQARFAALADDGKPALIFAAHLANWELPAICAATYRLDSAVLYRRPNIAALNAWIEETRAAHMGQIIPTELDAPVKLAEALARGAHVGMLVDQYFARGVEVAFFGRKTTANPLIARLARHFDCPIHGTRIVRLPGNRFRAELSEAVAPVREAGGAIDIAGTMQAITNVVEGWIREHPEQWLWLHRRWR
jgi:KDO2-lipid IV(A) lauroyltransferase